MKFHNRRLEILPDKSRLCSRRSQAADKVAVDPGLGLGESERRDPFEPVEVVGEADLYSFQRIVGNLKVPKSDQFAGSAIYQVSFHPLVNAVPPVAANVIPGKSPFHHPTKPTLWKSTTPRW